MSEPSEQPIVAGVELGGTKTIVVLGRGPDILERHRFATTGPDETLARAAEVLRGWRGTAQGLGIATFGPVVLDRGSPAFGRLLITSKAGWQGDDLLTPLNEALRSHDREVPIRLETDVTAAALAEGRWGAAIGLSDHSYVTIGTGTGVGVVAGGHALTPASSLEVGHWRIRRLPGDAFAGICPVHGDCWEGLASGPAIAARIGAPSGELTPDHPATPAIADALAEGFAQLLTGLSTRRIVVGGGAGLGLPWLLDQARQRTVEKLCGFLPWASCEVIGEVIVPAALGGDAGPLGALLLGAEAAG